MLPSYGVAAFTPWVTWIAVVASGLGDSTPITPTDLAILTPSRAGSSSTISIEPTNQSDLSSSRIGVVCGGSCLRSCQVTFRRHALRVIFMGHNIHHHGGDQFVDMAPSAWIG